MSTSAELDPTLSPEELAALEPVLATGTFPQSSPPDAPRPSPVTVGANPGPPPGEARGLEHYRTVRLLGEGGMGEVRLCKDLFIGREVAMKVIRPELASHTDTRMRFLSEAQVQGQLEHPAIVPVYELGALPDGTVFFTMKRLRGHTLAEILDGLAKGRADFAAQYTRQRLLAAFATVCMAVDFSHARGVLHRDLHS